ncbi:MAG: hypothetical protein ACFFD4_38790 [Candidatus Odinarchaeota archaeon]
MDTQFISNLSINEAKIEVSGRLAENSSETGVYLFILHLRVCNAIEEKDLEVALTVPPSYMTDPDQSKTIKLQKLSINSPDIYLVWRLRYNHPEIKEKAGIEKKLVIEPIKITIRPVGSNQIEEIVFSR